jgi:hypothetical protein
VVINTDGSNDVLPIYSTVTVTVGPITIDADAGPETVSLGISSGSLTTTGLVTVRGEQSTSETATLTVSSGATFAPSSLAFDGGATTATAIGDFDESVTVSSSITAQEYVDIQVKGGETVTAGSITFGVEDTTPANVSISRSDESGTGTITTSGGTLTVYGGSSSSTYVSVSSGASLTTQ